MSDSDLIEDLVKTLANQLKLQGHRLVTAESCTGGLIASALTNQAGCSAWFERGWVTYSNAAKYEELDVDLSLIETEGAVSESVAAAMARGAWHHGHADYAISVTGIAGPDGGTVLKPVGTVCFGWANSKICHTQTLVFSGDRPSIRKQATIHALSTLISLIPNFEHFSF